jgi:hypothetical protein
MRILHREGVRLPIFEVGAVRLAYSPATERLYVTYRGRRVGEITGSGLLRVSARLAAHKVADVKTLVENPLDVARGAAILLGLEARCPVCRRALDSKDRLQGIGPACYDKGEFWRLETPVALPRKHKGE